MSFGGSQKRLRDEFGYTSWCSGPRDSSNHGRRYWGHLRRQCHDSPPVLRVGEERSFPSRSGTGADSRGRVAGTGVDLRRPSVSRCKGVLGGSIVWYVGDGMEETPPIPRRSRRWRGDVVGVEADLRPPDSKTQGDPVLRVSIVYCEPWRHTGFVTSSRNKPSLPSRSRGARGVDSQR